MPESKSQEVSTCFPETAMVESELAGAEQQSNARLLAETAAQLSDSASRVEQASRLLPSDEDFHFYSNFSEFREPVQAIQARIQGLFSQISSLGALSRAPAVPSDPDGLPDWLVSTQDELLEQVDSAFDVFKKERAQQGLPPPENDAFMYQNTRKKRRLSTLSKDSKLQLSDEGKGVSMAEKKAERCPIRFHVWSIPRPQMKFGTPVDNSNTPFKHPKPLSGSSRSAESDASVHPLQELLENMNFEDILDSIADPKPPASSPETPFTFVNTPSLLKNVATKLSLEREIAVDLEHHQFRSFQGLTCLMQISTRSEDFVIDTLELWSIIGPHLYDVFANPAIQKVMHGAKGDVTWLQRDFGIYICNLFDTGQAARVLELESFGLAYLLERFCGFVPDKRYQMADWRLRPLPTEMLKYAREDTHYLLYVGDLLKQMLASYQTEALKEPLLEVYKRSRDICLILYEKEITIETSYLQVYGLEERNFQPQQLAVLSGLYSWRDQVARVEDESTGYVLPNHLLLKLAEEMPDDVKKLRTLLNGRHPLLARNIAVIVDIINKSKSALSSLESGGAVRIRAGKSKPSAIFEEIAFPESTPVVAEATEDEIMRQLDDKASDMNAEKVTLDVQGVKKVSSEHPLENTTVDFVQDLPCGADNSLPKTATVVLNRATKSSLFGKQEVREKIEDKLDNQKEMNFEGSHGVVVPEEDKYLGVRAVENVGAAVPSGVILKKASGPSLFLKTKKSNKIVQGLPILPVVTTEKQETNSEKFQADDSLGNKISLQTNMKGSANSEDPEQAEAKLRAGRIRASFSLPFHAFDGGDSSFEPATRHTKERVEQVLNENMAETGELQVAEDLILVENDSSLDDQETEEVSYSVSKGIACSADGIQHRVWWPNSLGTAQEQSVDSTTFKELPDMSDPRSLETDIPLSLSQKFRSLQRQRGGIQSEPQFTQLRTNDANDSENGPTMRPHPRLPTSFHHGNQRSDVETPSFTPFDYAAAKKNMGFFSEARAATEGRSTAGSMSFNEGNNRNHTGNSERIFDPHRRVKDFKPEGISPGKRRQVFPQTGNRTGVFK